MRVVAEVSHPQIKISILSYNQKYVLKFELGGYEQTYKIAEMDLLEGLEGAKKIVQNADFQHQVMQQFITMRTSFTQVIKVESAY